MVDEENRELAKRKDELAEVSKEEMLKPGMLRDDSFEDIVHREYTSRQGQDEDASLRVTPIYDEESGKGKLITTGKGKVQDAMDKVLRTERIEHERVTPKAYPGEEGFEPEKVRHIAGPRIARTVKAIREARGAPKPPLLEDIAMDLEERLSRFLGLEQPKEDEEASEAKELRQLNEATESFTPSFRKSEKKGGE